MPKALRLAVLVFPLIFIVARAATPQSSIRPSEQALLQSANRERAAKGFAPLKWSAPLAGAAHEHVLLLAQQNRLSHQLPGEAAWRSARHASERFSVSLPKMSPRGQAPKKFMSNG